MPILAACPHCSATLNAPDRLAGTAVACPKCQGQMLLPDAEPEYPVVRAVEAPRDDRDDDRPVRRKRRRRVEEEEGGNGAILLAAGVAGMALLGVGVAVALALRGREAAEARPAPPQPAVVAPMPVAPAAPVAPVAAAAPVPAGLAADIPGESPVATGQDDRHTLLRPRASDSIYQLSNLFTRPGGFGMAPGSTHYSIDWKRVRKGSHAGTPSIMVRVDGGSPQQMLGGLMMFAFERESDRLEVQLRTIGFGGFGRESKPLNVEFYLTSYGWVPEGKSFKVSNSVTAGTVAETTKFRDWTAAESEAVRSGKDRVNPNPPPPPPPSKRAQEYVGLEEGEETRTTGSPHVIGFDVKLAADQTLEGIFPVFRADEPARPGHARHVAAGCKLVMLTVYRTADGRPGGIKAHFFPEGGRESHEASRNFPPLLGREGKFGDSKMVSLHGTKVTGMAVRSAGGKLNGLQMVAE